MGRFHERMPHETVVAIGVIIRNNEYDVWVCAICARCAGADQCDDAGQQYSKNHDKQATTTPITCQTIGKLHNDTELSFGFAAK